MIQELEEGVLLMTMGTIHHNGVNVQITVVVIKKKLAGKLTLLNHKEKLF